MLTSFRLRERFSLACRAVKLVVEKAYKKNAFFHVYISGQSQIFQIT
jgi:hypothetical protein